MNFIELINATQKRLRETTTSTVDATKYSTLVAAFVNDAKTIVESAWDWSQNRSVITVTTVADTQVYSLTGAGQDPEVLGAWNDTQNAILPKRQELLSKHLEFSQVAQDGTPEWWTFKGNDGTDAQITVWPNPNAVDDLKFWVYNVQAELVLTTDEMNVPWKPVVLLAVAMLAEEKGETGGTTSKRYFEMADTVLSDAIARDASQSDREIDWNTV
jgi:hypothetical protein